jgi:hypothetical protein
LAELLDLAKDMQALAVKLPIAASEVAKDVARTVLHDLTQVTPVDTGLALSNWQVGIGSAPGGIVPPFSPSPRGRVKQGVWVHSVDPIVTAQANAQPTFDAGNNAINSKTVGEDIYIVNNVDYISILDSGSSNQAPAGFVDRAVILGEQVKQRAKIL